MDYRYFELNDLLCTAVIALEASDAATAATRLWRALAELELHWLATPAELTRDAAPERARAVLGHDTDEE